MNEIIGGELERVEKRIEEVAQMLEQAAEMLRTADAERLERLRDLSKKLVIIANSLASMGGVKVEEMERDEVIGVYQWKIMRVRELALAISQELNPQETEVKND